MTPIPPASAMAITSLASVTVVHRGGNDRQVEADRAGELRSDIRCARHHRAWSWTQQDVVERKAFGNRIGFNPPPSPCALMWIEGAECTRPHPLHGAAA